MSTTKYLKEVTRLVRQAGLEIVKIDQAAHLKVHVRLIGGRQTQFFMCARTPTSDFNAIAHTRKAIARVRAELTGEKVGGRPRS